MPKPKWQLAIDQWRALSREEQKSRRLRNIPRSVASSMVFEGEPVDEKLLIKWMAIRHPEIFPEINLNNFTTARYALYRKPLPRIEDAVCIGELMRQAVTSQAKKIFGEDNIPAVFSGHGMPSGNRHGHAFYLPEDADGDGFIDHIIVHANYKFDADCLRILDQVTKLWDRKGNEWQILLENIDQASAFSSTPLLQESKKWISVTPYLHPWFRKNNFTIEDQLRRECEKRNLWSIASIDPIVTVSVGGRQRTPLYFDRFRSKRGLTQPDIQGSFWMLTFSESIQGPLALGFGCHFGLGLFRGLD